jgi:hypothetical protein
MVPVSQPPGAGESGTRAAAEGATGPRKRSGNRDRVGIRDLWKDGGRVYARRTDGVRRREAPNLSGPATEGGQPRWHSADWMTRLWSEP